MCDLLALSVTVGLLGLAFYFVRRPGDEARAFGIAVIAGLSSSLVVWPHYLALLFVPIALLSPTLSPLWLVPLLAYAAPSELTHHQFWNIAPYLLIELIMVGAICSWAAGTRAPKESGIWCRPRGDRRSSPRLRRPGQTRASAESSRDHTLGEIALRFDLPAPGDLVQTVVKRPAVGQLIAGILRAAPQAMQPVLSPSARISAS